jgi:short-subunit dehydrogenase
MVGRGGGRIINVASWAGDGDRPYLTGDACSKAAVLKLTEGLAGPRGRAGSLSSRSAQGSCPPP